MTRFIPVLLFLLITSTATAEVYHHPVDKITKSTADHTKFPQLKKNFKSGPEVTKACLEMPYRSIQADSPDQALDMGSTDERRQDARQTACCQQLLHFS